MSDGLSLVLIDRVSETRVCSCGCRSCWLSCCSELTAKNMSVLEKDVIIIQRKLFGQSSGRLQTWHYTLCPKKWRLNSMLEKYKKKRAYSSPYKLLPRYHENDFSAIFNSNFNYTAIFSSIISIVFIILRLWTITLASTRYSTCLKWPYSARVAAAIICFRNGLHSSSSLWMRWSNRDAYSTPCFRLCTFNTRCNIGLSVTFFVILRRWILWKCSEL